METDRTLQPDIHSDNHSRYLMNDYCQASSFSHIYIYIHIHIYIYIYTYTYIYIYMRKKDSLAVSASHRILTVEEKSSY